MEIENTTFAPLVSLEETEMTVPLLTSTPTLELYTGQNK